MNLNDKITQARKLGTVALSEYYETASPALNPGVMALTEGMAVGEGAVLIYQAYQDAWWAEYNREQENLFEAEAEEDFPAYSN